MNNDTNQQAVNPARQPKQGGHCCPGEDGPADQPKPPHDTCPPPDTQGEPELPPVEGPAPCKVACNCPATDSGKPDCFDDLINVQARVISEAERAKTFKADLEALLQKAKAAQSEYTSEKYKQLLERWKQQDNDIVDLIHRVVCANPCWYCQLECQVCALFNKVRDLELQLNGDGKKEHRYSKTYSLYDQRYWLERDLALKQATFDRIKAVLTAWEKPAGDIEAVLNDNQKLIAAIKSADSAQALYDLFIKLIPSHLAIAPPATTPATTTGIDKKYTQLCCCDQDDPDDCCGPDVGEQTVRLRLQGRHAYLVDPAQYFTIICCLVKSRYLPAKDELAKAEGLLSSKVAEIKRVNDEIKSRIDSLEKTARAELAKPFDCTNVKPVEDSPGQQQQQQVN
ncbi:hypothetical protein [Duganella sp. HH105]|uniref:hypothetical protein n=1 Tax=Duganella sp. HH105 TaxID=1781067 RepID=UPI000877D1CD|nr:hypothetical protein [Duganella sp. HH105]OEZ63928.1 hypothetical protein DUGA6_04290 [Duganella sp. HH105]